MDLSDTLQIILVAAPPAILAITLHEAAHGYAARHFGDPTAWQAGRISLNPLRHIDPIGTLLLPLLLALFKSPILFGWAKPVPVSIHRLRRPKRDMLWVAAAGPAVNLLMALGWTALLKLDTLIPYNMLSQPLALMCQVGIGINLSLAMLNLFPLPPLDGGRIAVSLLPEPLASQFAQLERWGFFILIALLYLGALDVTVWPLVDALERFILSLFALT
mgnify:FL=1